MTVENPYKSLLILLILTLITACHGASNEVTLDAPETLVGKDAVIYGNDDRQEVYQHDGDVFGQIARNATAVLVQSNSIYSSGGSVTLYGASLGQTMGLCSDERFYSQPTPGFCSGTLIAPDLILTAGIALAIARAAPHASLLIIITRPPTSFRLSRPMTSTAALKSSFEKKGITAAEPSTMRL